MDDPPYGFSEEDHKTVTARHMTNPERAVDLRNQAVEAFRELWSGGVRTTLFGGRSAFGAYLPQWLQPLVHLAVLEAPPHITHLPLAGRRTGPA
jgi:hypothetical protein